MTTTIQNTHKGRASMRVAREITPEGMQIPITGQVSFNLVEAQSYLDLWQRYLLLPEQYTVVGVYFDILYQCWTLILESADIPLPAPNDRIPIFIPTYERVEEDGKFVVRIRDWQVL